MPSLDLSTQRAFRILVVDDNAATAGAIQRFLRPLLPGAQFVTCASLAAGHREISAGMAGAILDACLPDGGGLELVAEIRARAPRAALLAVTGSTDAWIANQAVEAGVMLARKPELAGPLQAFSRRVSAAAAHVTGESGSLARRISEVAVDVLAESARLTPRGREIVRLLNSGTRRERLAEVLGIEESSVRSHVRELLARAGAARVDALAWRLLRICDELVEAGFGEGAWCADPELARASATSHGAVDDAVEPPRADAC